MIRQETAEGISPDKPLVVLAEFYDSGGTRTYLKQLLEFYAESGRSVILVGCYSEPDAEIAAVLRAHSFSFVSYFDILNAGSLNHSSARKWVPKVWSPGYMKRERVAFRQFLSQSGAQGIVVSAGTPGLFAGAAGATESGVYILHTYPHGRRQEYLGRFLMKAFFSRVKRFVAVSQFQKDQMTRLWRLSGGDERIEVIRNSTGPVLGARVGVAPTGGVVITASWVEEYKNPEFWIQTALIASKELSKAQIQFTWFGSGSMLEVSRVKATAIAEFAHAEFAGHVPSPEVEYVSAFVYLQPSSVENMSLSVIEALRFGLPAVVTNVGGLPEIVENGITGFVVPSDSPELAAAAIIRLTEDSELWSQMSQASQARYSKYFAPESWGAAMSDLHNEVFGEQWNG